MKDRARHRQLERNVDNMHTISRLYGRKHEAIPHARLVKCY